MAFEFKLPDIGEGIHEGEIVQWLVKPGDFVREDQAIVEVMTDKVTAEIPAPVSGTIQELRGNAGDVVRVGSVIAVFDQQGASGTASPSQAGAAKNAQYAASASAQTSAGQERPASKPSMQNVEATASTATPNQVPARSNEATKVQQIDTVKPANGNGKHQAAASDRGGVQVLAAPATRKLAREMGVDLNQVAGSGPRGRVTQEDVRAFQAGGARAGQLSLAPAAGRTIGADGFRSAGEQRVPFAGLRRKIAEHLVKSKQTAPHFAYVEEVDMSELVRMRDSLLPVADEEGVKLTYLPFIIKAVIAGLRKFPSLNAQLDDARQEIVYKHDYHMGIAVATDQGLVVPVVKYADQKSLFTLAREIVDLAARARAGKLALDDMRGGTFTLTSIGSIGGLFSVPIINYPEVAILGVNKIERRPVVRMVDGEERIAIRDVMYLSLAGDHRVVDGSEVALFVKEVIQYLENPSRLLLVEGA